MRGHRGAGVMRPWAALAFLAVSCDGGGPAPAGGADGGVTDAGTAWAVVAPAAPALLPCPAGWIERGDREAPSCDPWPEGVRPACGAGEAWFPGADGCRRIGAECPAGDWPEELPPETDVRYVRAGAPAGGDGSRAAPFGTIAAAIEAAPIGATIAVARGTYPEGIVPRTDQTIRGVCAAETRIAAPAEFGRNGTITAGAAGVTIRDLSVGGDVPGIFVSGMLASMRVEGVIVEGTRPTGIVARYGAMLIARDLAVRSTRSAADGTSGQGLIAFAGAQLDLERVEVVASHEAGVLAFGAGTTVRARSLAVRATTAPPADPHPGHGIVVDDGAVVELEASVLEDNLRIGAGVWDGGLLRITDTIIRGTRGAFSMRTPKGWALSAIGPGTILDVSRVVCEDNQSRGIVVGQEAHAALVDLIVRDTIPPSSNVGEGAGLHVDYAADAEVERAVLARNQRVGAGVWLDATLRLRDVSIVDTQLGHGSDLAAALAVSERGTLTGERIAVRGARARAVHVATAGSSAVLTETVVEDVTPTPDCVPDCPAGDVLAIGVAVTHDAAFELTRFEVRHSALVGLQLAEGGTADLHDGRVWGHAIGVNLQTTPFDFARLEDRILYYDNETNLDSTVLPVPAPIIRELP